MKPGIMLLVLSVLNQESGNSTSRKDISSQGEDGLLVGRVILLGILEDLSSHVSSLKFQVSLSQIDNLEVA